MGELAKVSTSDGVNCSTDNVSPANPPPHSVCDWGPRQKSFWYWQGEPDKPKITPRSISSQIFLKFLKYLKEYFQIFHLTCMNVLPTYVLVYYAHGWYLKRSEDGIRLLGTEVRVSCEQPCGCWEPKLSSQLEQSMPLTAKLSLQALIGYLTYFYSLEYQGW